MFIRPEKIPGGCLCGAIHYEISFPKDAAWPADSCTCQCSMCRKWTGALLSHEVLLKSSQLSPDLSTLPTYKEYQSSEEATRAFCSACGSGLTWRLKSMPDLLVVMLGSVDEDVLIGQRVDGTEEQTALGLKFKRAGGLSQDLCRMNMGNLFWNNVVPGVTDHDVGGTKFMQSFPQEGS